MKVEYLVYGHTEKLILNVIFYFLRSCINIADTREGSVSNLCLGEAKESDIAKHARVLSDVNELYYLYKTQYNLYEGTHLHAVYRM